MGVKRFMALQLSAQCYPFISFCLTADWFGCVTSVITVIGINKFFINFWNGLDDSASIPSLWIFYHLYFYVRILKIFIEKIRSTWQTKKPLKIGWKKNIVLLCVCVCNFVGCRCEIPLQMVLTSIFQIKTLTKIGDI